MPPYNFSNRNIRKPQGVWKNSFNKLIYLRSLFKLNKYEESFASLNQAIKFHQNHIIILTEQPSTLSKKWLKKP